MPLLHRKGVLAIAAVIDIAMHGRSRLVSAKTLAARHELPLRHLEPVLQALVREGILKGVRGPHGGYHLAAGSVEEEDRPPLPSSTLISGIVRPARTEAERAFSAALSRINIDDMAKAAEALK